MSSALALNIDIAPTIAAVAGVPALTDGRSLLQLLGGDDAGWRTRFLIEHMEGSNPVPTYCAVRTERYLFARYATGERELYDLQADPFELTNVAIEDAALSDDLHDDLNTLCHPAPPGYHPREGAVAAASLAAVALFFGIAVRRRTFSDPHERRRDTARMSRPRSSLFVASFLMLFVELALIRGTTAAVVYLSFFTNLVLLASFLGIGLGFLRARGDPRRSAMVAAVAVGRAAVPAALPREDRPRRRTASPSSWDRRHACPSEWLRLSGDLPRRRAGDGLHRRAGRRLFAAFAPLGRLPARRARQHRAGSSCSRTSSFADAGPLVWVVIAVACCVVPPAGLTRGSRVVACRLGRPSRGLQPRDIWSPLPHCRRSRSRADGRVTIRVNNRPHQTMAPLADLLTEQPFYARPYTHLRQAPATC